MATPLYRSAGDGRAPGSLAYSRPCNLSSIGFLPSSMLPSHIPTAAITANPHPCRPLTSGHAGRRAGPAHTMLVIRTMKDFAKCWLRGTENSRL